MTTTAPHTDRCPGVLALHEAADGLLIRVRIPGGRIDAAGLRAIAGLAARRGNGIVELTSRASLQVRGLCPGDAAEAARTLSDAGLLPSPAHERARNILASPVAGRHPQSTLADADGLVAALDRALCSDPELAGLGGRFQFAVHDGSPTLDVRRAEVVLDGPGDLPGALRRARALRRGAPSSETRSSGEPSRLTPGLMHQRDGRVAATAMVPLARVEPTALRALAELATAHDTDVRIAPERTVTLVDLPAAAGAGVLAGLRDLGLIDVASGWRGLTACAGLGACARARVDVRSLAANRARHRGTTDPPEHWAACPRGCGRPPEATLRGAR